MFDELLCVLFLLSVLFGNICTIFTSVLHEVAMEGWKGTFKCCNLASPCKIKYVHNVYILNTAKLAILSLECLKIQQPALFK